jgi:hypothetical protein
VGLANGVPLAGAAKPLSHPTSTRPFRRYSRPAILGRVVLREKIAGSVQIRYSPVGPVIVPLSVSWTVFAMVGQPEAGVTVVGVGVGLGVGVTAGGLLIVTLPGPGDAISLAPQPASIGRAAPASKIVEIRAIRVIFVVSASDCAGLRARHVQEGLDERMSVTSPDPCCEGL